MKTYNLNLKIEIPEQLIEQLKLENIDRAETLKYLLTFNTFRDDIKVEIKDSQEENLLNEIDKLKSDIKDLTFDNTNEFNDDSIDINDKDLEDLLDDDNITL